jgi:hypothetical protein
MDLSTVFCIVVCCLPLFMSFLPFNNYEQSFLFYWCCVVCCNTCSAATYSILNMLREHTI